MLNLEFHFFTVTLTDDNKMHPFNNKDPTIIWYSEESYKCFIMFVKRWQRMYSQEMAKNVKSVMADKTFQTNIS